MTQGSCVALCRACEMQKYVIFHDWTQERNAKEHKDRIWVYPCVATSVKAKATQRNASPCVIYWTGSNTIDMSTAYSYISFVDSNELSDHPHHIVIVIGPVSQPRGLTDRQTLLHTPSDINSNRVMWNLFLVLRQRILLLDFYKITVFFNSSPLLYKKKKWEINDVHSIPYSRKTSPPALIGKNLSLKYYYRSNTKIAVLGKNFVPWKLAIRYSVHSLKWSCTYECINSMLT